VQKWSHLLTGLQPVLFPFADEESPRCRSGVICSQAYSLAWQPGFRAWSLNQVTGAQAGAGRLQAPTCPLLDLILPI
jgi:hypothetical protein